MVEMSYKDDVKAVARLHLPWEKLRGCSILVTGATGLIGSCLVEVLMERTQRDYTVYAMGRNTKRMEKLFRQYIPLMDFHVILGDVTLPMETELPFHYIIHAASGATPFDFAQHPVEIMKANIYGLTNLLDYGIRHQLKRFLFISSGEVYGMGDGRAFTENDSGYVDSMNARSCYPSAKRASETLCASYAAEYGVDIVVARPCHVYGPHFTENDNRAYAQFLRNAIAGEDIVMKGSGEQFRSWCYVVDCASAIFHVLLKGKCGLAYNIADSTANVNIRQLAEMIAKIVHKKVVICKPEDGERKGYNVVTKSVYDTTRLENLGWEIRDTLEDKLRKTIDALT